MSPGKKKRKGHHPKKSKSTSLSSSTDEFLGFSSMSEESSDDDNFHSIPDEVKNIDDNKEDVKSQSCCVCKDRIVNSDDFMECDGCRGVFHLPCSDFNKEVFTVLKKQKCFGDIMWCCTQCKTRGTKVRPPQDDTMINLIKALQVRVSKLEDKNTPNPAKQFPSWNAQASQSDVASHQVFMIPEENQKLDIKTFADIARKKLPNIPIKKLGKPRSRLYKATRQICL